MNLARTLVIANTHRDLPLGFARSLLHVVAAGGNVLMHHDMSGQTLARNVLLTTAYRAIMACTAPSSSVQRTWIVPAPIDCIDCVLTLDHDTIISTDQIDRLAKLAHTTGQPQAGRYLTSDGRGAWYNLPDGSVLAGFGCLMIPARRLLELGPKLPSFQWNNQPWIQWTLDGPQAELPNNPPNTWLGDDFAFSRTIGPVKLSDVKVGHQKPVVFTEPKD